jgi:hypothetical protein
MNLKKSFMSAMRGIYFLEDLTDCRIAETAGNIARQELDEKLVFKGIQKVDLGLKEATRTILHQGDVTRKSDTKLDWLDVHLILLDNFLIMTKKRRERNVEKFIVSKQVPSLPELTNSANPGRFIAT